MSQSIRYKLTGLVGFEFETTGIPGDIVMGIAGEMDGLLKFDHDASSESRVTWLSSKLALFNNTDQQLPGAVDTTGTELISLLLYPSEFQSTIWKLFSKLEMRGEINKSLRSALHFHVGCQQNLAVIKKALTFSTKFESLFFQLGGMGYRHRGEENKMTYCRPMSSPYGPPVVQCSDGYERQVFTVEHLLASRSVDEFWRLFQVDPDNPKRYHPCRYFGLNVMALLHHNTLEYRFFNTTLVPQYVIAMMEFVRGCTEFISVSPPVVIDSFATETVYQKHDNPKQLETLISTMNPFLEDKISLETKRILHRILEETPQVILKEEYVQTHKWGSWSAAASSMRTRMLPSGVAVPSGFIDSHQSESNHMDLTAIANR